MGSIHPNGSLYEEPLDLSKAQEEHRKFRQLLESEGCVVKTVREILTSEKGDIAKRVRLEEFAFKCIKYELDPAQRCEELGTSDQLLLSDDYKRECIDSMSVEQLVEVILTRPTIKLRKSERDTDLLATEYSFQPLVNLVFQRDQQITTAKGIVMASLSSPIRAPEVELMRLCFDLLGLPVIGEIPQPGRLEGGDFYPAGSDLCFIGVGLRSNFAAVEYLMANDLLGTTRVAVVKDYFDLDQQRMHLDTVCNIINERVILILEDICGESSPIRRLVDEYVRDDKGHYTLARHDIEFSAYLREQGYELVMASDRNQKDYGCNGLNIGNGKFIVVDQATAKTIARAMKSAVKLLYVDFRTVTKMYGSVHCCSQVVSRRATAAHSPTKLPPAKLAPATKPTGQLPHRALMVSPTYYVKARIGSELINASVIRETRARVLQDYSALHGELRKHGLDVHLFCHEPYHHTAQAVYVSEWFSTHSAAEAGVPTLVLYPLESRQKRRERRRDILTYGLSAYQRVLDLTSCERGDIRVFETTMDNILSGMATTDQDSFAVYDTPTANGQYCDFGGLVLDRVHKVVYAAVDESRYHSAVVDIWAKALGYTLIKVVAPGGLAASHFLFIGSKTAVFCHDAVSSQESDMIETRLRADGLDVVSITRAQMESSCAKILELGSNTEKPLLVMSQACHRLLNQRQLEQLLTNNSQIIQVDMSHIESLGGTGIYGMVGGLY
eukprot:gene15287-18100_t